jgi:hypothetical protein
VQQIPFDCVGNPVPGEPRIRLREHEHQRHGGLRSVDGMGTPSCPTLAASSCASPEPVVQLIPGEKTLTAMLNSFSSCASDSVQFLSAALLIEYGCMPGKPKSPVDGPDVDDAAGRCSIIGATNCLVTRSGPSTLTSIISLPLRDVEVEGLHIHPRHHVALAKAGMFTSTSTVP